MKTKLANLESARVFAFYLYCKCGHVGYCGGRFPVENDLAILWSEVTAGNKGEEATFSLFDGKMKVRNHSDRFNDAKRHQ